jgi:multidrug efflux pump subunit AcrA (membrane-fusion protein)
MVTLVARVPDPYGRGSEVEGAPLVAGLFVEAVIQGRTLEDAIALPREAVHMGGRVFLLDDGRLEIRPVRVVWADREEVVVEGVAPGEEVVLTPLELPIEGMQLERQTAPGSAR